MKKKIQKRKPRTTHKLHFRNEKKARSTMKAATKLARAMGGHDFAFVVYQSRKNNKHTIHQFTRGDVNKISFGLNKTLSNLISTSL